METLLLIGLAITILFWLLKYLAPNFDVFSFFILFFVSGYFISLFRNVFESVSYQLMILILVVSVGGTLAYVIWKLVKKQKLFDFSGSRIKWWAAPIVILVLVAFGFAYRAGPDALNITFGAFLVAMIVDRFIARGRYKKELHTFNKQEKRVIEGIKHMRAHNDEITNQMYRELVNISEAQATIDLDLLEEKGFIEQIGDTGRYVTYRLII